MKQNVKNRNLFFFVGAVILLAVLLSTTVPRFLTPPKQDTSEDRWKKVLTKQQYYVLRQGGTDVPFSYPEILHEKRKGTYVTADCAEPVFRSEDKFDSGTGWPSFTKPLREDAVVLKTDTTLGMQRVEVISNKCGSHLGHVFNDGPTVLPDGRKATGKRYCINASALKFIPDSGE